MQLALALLTAALVSLTARPVVPGAGTWIAFVPLLVALLRTRHPLAGFGVGWVAGLGAGIVAFEGVAPVELVAYPILVILTAVPSGIMAMLVVLLRRHRGEAAALLAFPALLVATTYLPAQRWLLGPFADTVSSVATTQVDTPLRFVAAWSGGSAIVLLVGVLNVAIFALVTRRAVFASLLAIVVSFGVAFFPVPGRAVPSAEGATLTVAIAQGAVPSIESLLAFFGDDAADRVLAPYVELTRAAAEREADLVVWGETVLPRPLTPGELPPALAEALAGAPTVLAGGISFVRPDTFNAIFHWSDGLLTEVYRKRALVPLNERQYTPGVALPPLDVEGVGVGLGICLDSVVPTLARDAVVRGAQMLVYLTDDAFAGRTVMPTMHLRHTVLRAVETGRWVVFANQSGPSAFVGPFGRIRQRLEYGATAGAILPVPALVGVTPFVRFGDWLGPLAILSLVAGLAVRGSSEGGEVEEAPAA